MRGVEAGLLVESVERGVEGRRDGARGLAREEDDGDALGLRVGILVGERVPSVKKIDLSQNSP